MGRESPTVSTRVIDSDGPVHERRQHGLPPFVDSQSCSNRGRVGMGGARGGTPGARAPSSSSVRESQCAAAGEGARHVRDGQRRRPGRAAAAVGGGCPFLDS